MSSNSQAAVSLFTTVLSGGNLPVIPYAEDFKNTLEPDENVSIQYSSGKKGAIENLTLFYRSPGNTNEIIPVYFGNFTTKEVKKGIPLKKIKKALYRLNIEAPENLFI